jgi:hypothetical protein
MSSIRLRYRETTADDLPMVCMACGDRAGSHIDKNFSWYPDWVNLTAFAGLVPYLILSFTTRQYMEVEVPVCDRHEKYFLTRTIWTYVAAGATFVIAALAFVLLLAASEGDTAGAIVGGMACFGVRVLPAIGVIAYIQTTTIRAREITDRSITLVRVHDDFVEAMEIRREGATRKASPRRRGRDDDDGFEEVEEIDPAPPKRRESFREGRPRRRRDEY